MLSAHGPAGLASSGTPEHNRPTQLLNATGIKGGIHDHLVLKYQPSVTSRLIFQYLMIINGIK